MENRIYEVALTLVDGVGDVNAKALLAYCGSAEAVFREKKSKLLKIPGIGEKMAGAVVRSHGIFKRAEEELAFVNRYGIKMFFFTDAGYPNRLRYCDDAPVVLYYKGTADLNAERIVAVVGTRKPTEYGRQRTKELVHEMKSANVMVLSGLAYGVDALAHRVALDCGIPTIGVLGHGLDNIYPRTHDRLAKKMLTCGGLLTEFMSNTKPDAVNFPKRNRIVAGMCDALVVVESRRTGGSLITATIASSYNKDVFAIPGHAGDPMAEGCNGLIKRNKAALVESGVDVLDAMNWNSRKEEPSKERKVQYSLPVSVTPEEQQLLELLAAGDPCHIDQLTNQMKMPVSQVSTLLLQLEFSGYVKSKPGKMYLRASIL